MFQRLGRHLDNLYWIPGLSYGHSASFRLFFFKHREESILFIALHLAAARAIRVEHFDQYDVCFF